MKIIFLAARLERMDRIDSSGLVWPAGWSADVVDVAQVHVTQIDVRMHDQERPIRRLSTALSEAASLAHDRSDACLTAKNMPIIYYTYVHHDDALKHRLILSVGALPKPKSEVNPCVFFFSFWVVSQCYVL